MRRLLVRVGWSVVSLVTLSLAFVYWIIPAVEGPRARRAVQMELRSALAEVSAPGNAAKVARLIDRGADIHTVGYGGTTVLIVAAWWDDAALARRALDAGADPNVADVHGNTPLVAGTFGPGEETMRLLLGAGADPNRGKADGDTPLMLAVRNARHDLIPLLLAAGARVEVANVRGETARSLARGLTHDGPRPMRHDLTADDFVRMLDGKE